MSDLVRASINAIDEGAHENNSPRHNIEAAVFAQEAAALVPRLHAQLRERLSTIYQELFPGQSLDAEQACIDVLAENMKSRDAATDHCVSVHTVYRCTAKLKKQACVDETVRDLLTQIREHRGDLNEYA